MRWLPCNSTAFQSPPSPRMGHTAVLVDATESWGEELLVIFGGLSEEKYALGDLKVLQARTVAWFHPEVPNSTSPPARAFHCGAAIGKKAYIFGGHVWVKQTRGLQKFDDFWCLDTVRSQEQDYARMHCLFPPPLGLAIACITCSLDAHQSRASCALQRTLHSSPTPCPGLCFHLSDV